MSKIVVNYNGGASDEYATFKGLNEAFSGQVFKGLDVVPNGSANMTVRVNPGSGRIPTGTAPADYYYMISHDTTAGESVTIATAASSPRIDYVVAYVDKSVTAITSPVNNTNNVLKFAAVAGTPAASPVVPTTAQIQSAIGAANPYVILAQVAVAASATQITAPNITDRRLFVAALFNAYKFNGYLNTAQGVPANAWTKVGFNAKQFDTSGSFDVTSTSRLTVPITGYYFLQGQIQLTNSGATDGSTSQSAIYKNGSGIAFSGVNRYFGNVTSIPVGSVSGLFYLQAGDQIELWGYLSDSGRVFGAGPDRTFMTGFLVSAT